MSHGSELVSEVQKHWLLHEARRLVEFATGSVDPHGSIGWLDDHGGRQEGKPLQIYIGCRMTHVFSIGEALWPNQFRSHIEAGLSAIDSVFADTVHGGWFHSDDEQLATYPKTAYDHAFVTLAAASAAARGITAGDRLLHRALHVLDEHFWDETKGLVREAFSRDWKLSEPYRGANSNMHAVEAFLAAADVTGDHTWRARALRIVDRIVNGWARPNNWRIVEHFDDNWQPLLDYNIGHAAHPFRPYGATVGHGMEWARLCLQLQAATPGVESAWLVESATALYARAKADGWARDGADGFLYTVDWDGCPVVHERMHWVVAEATAAAAALHQVTGEHAYAEDFHNWWNYIRSYLLDRRHGSWRHELSRTNQPSRTVWCGKPDVYHALQACLLPLLPLRPSIALSVTPSMLG
ncbi:AGE family epimerase/isomerase [Mycolicibacterium cosmeticum]|uniref:AGE family epimerase/isomerase n=1 Tax=Mycolicibacterium cosmeticum TaxID=258533 RepID=UPI003204F439